MKVDAIFHLADIHIRILTRHNEYRSAYKKLFDKAKEIEDKYENPICVIAGDIVHAKIDMSPELIQMITELTEGLSNILPVYVYPGNHDANLNNPNRMDALEPILTSISKYSELRYIKDDEVVKFDNMKLYHMSVFDDVENYVDGSKLDNKTLNFVVYHGAVNDAFTDKNYKLSNDRITTKLFDGFDGVILGDIHKRQCLQKRSSGKPEIWYPGSLVQQNHGESIDNHGGLIWEISGKDFKIIEWNIDHEYGYVTIPVSNGNMDLTNLKIPKKPRIRLKVENTSISQIKKIKSKLRAKYKVQDIQIAKDKSSVIMDDSDNKIDLGDMQDPEYQNSLIKEYVSIAFPNDNNNEVLDELFKINRDINKDLGSVKSIRNTSWKPIRFEFSNTFSYGENNIIDFTKLDGVYGIFAPNTSGKSSLLDSILFALFDMTSRTNKTSDIMNVEKDWLKTKFVFELQEKTFVIERDGKRVNDTAKLNVNFYSIDSDGNKTILNGTDRKDTNKIIHAYIGRYYDFIMSTFSLQTMSSNFIEMRQSERKYTLSQFLDIIIFDDLNQIAKDEAKELSGYIRKEKKNDYDVRLSEANEKYKFFDEKIKELESEKAKLTEELNNNAIDLGKLQSKKHNIDFTISDVNSYQEQLIENENKLSNNQEQLNNLSSKWLDVSQSYCDIKSEFESYDSEELERQYKIKIDIEDSIVSHTKKIENIDTKIQSEKDLLNHLSEHKYNESCDVCLDNSKSIIQKTNESKKKIDRLETEKSDINRDLTQDKSSLSRLINIGNTYIKYKLISDQYVKKQNSFYTIKHQQDQYISDEIQLKNNISKIKSEIEIINSQKQKINENAKIDIEIEKIESEMDNLNHSLHTISLELSKENQSIGFYRNIITDIEDKLKKLHDAEQEYAIYEIYLKATSRDGIPKFIIEKALPKIESEINRILNQLVDFNIVFNMNNNDIDTYIVYDDDRYWSLSLSSGMERFISSLAIRVALINITSLPKPNFIAIDEGWGSLSKENLDNIFMLFDYLRSEFETTLVISHLESMRDIVDGLIEINKIDNISNIKVI